MKKMKRFLSLLICMVMLASFMPIGAAALDLNYVTVTVPNDKDVDGITATGRRQGGGGNTRALIITDRTSTKAYKGNNQDTVTVTLTMEADDGDYFRFFGRPVDVVTVSGATKDEVTYDWSTRVLTVKLKFDVAHSHKGEPVAAESASCVQPGTKAYYECSCGKNYEDEACQNEIADLTKWKAFGAHKLELVPKQDATCTVDGYQAYYKCTNHGCGKFFSDEAMTQEITETEWKSGDGKIAAGHTYGDTYSKNETHHWKQCTLENCPAKEASVKDYAEHVYDPAETGTICTVCQYNRGVEITFDFQYEGKTEKKTVVKGATVEAPASPTRYQHNHEYKVVGWYYNSRCTQPVDLTQGVTEDDTWYAKWAMVHELTYHGPDGSVVGTQEVFHGDTAGSFNPAEPVNIPGYYTPSKWYRDTDGDVKFNFESDIVNNCTDLYGEWVAKSYTVIFKDGNEEVKTETYAFGDKVVKYEMEKEGHKLEGWYTDAGLTNEYNFNNPVNTDMTLFAKWEVITYTVKFEFGDGYGWTMDDQTFTYGEAAKALSASTFSKDGGFAFVGWNTENDGTGAGFEDKQVISALDLMDLADDKYVVVLYGQYAPTYTITFDTGDGSDVDPIIAVAGATIVPPADPTLNGYTFMRWSPALPEIMPAENMELEAVWARDTFTVNLHGNGGAPLTRTGEPDITLTVECGESFTLPAFTREGYTLSGWQTKDGATSYKPDATVTLTAEKGAVIDLYAQWTVNQYTITFDTDGGTEIAPITLDYGAAVTAPADPTKEGHTFAGWDIEVPSTMPAENLTITASWTVNRYKVTFKNGDEIVKEETLDYGAPIVAPADPSKAGHTFKGWGTVPATMPAEDQVFSAVWEEIPVVRYAITYHENNGTDNNWTTVVVEGTDYVIESATGIEAPAGKVFKHWKVKNGVKTYKPGDKIEKIADDYEFEAVWTKKTAASDLDYVPAAGDNFPVLLWAGMILFGAIALVETVSTRKKRS